MSEARRLADSASFYTNDQLDVDRFLVRKRYEAVAPHVKGPTGLELGPADGEMTQYLLPHFERLISVDGAAELLDQIPDDARLTKVVSLFEDFEPGEQFATIVLDHILEHVGDPVAILRRAVPWLAPGGVMLVGVPNAQSIHRLAAVHMGLLPTPYTLNERDVTLGHRRVYDWSSLEADLAAAGVTVIEHGGTFLKPLANFQMQAWTPDMLDAFAELGREFPDNAAELYAICTTGAG